MNNNPKIKVIILSIFPEIFDNFLKTSLIGKAIANKNIEIKIINFRDYAQAPHFRVDDEIYGGGAGVLLKPEPLLKALKASKKLLPNSKSILLSASGIRFTQEKAQELSEQKELVFVCGRYEGVDQRVIDSAIDEEIRIGDFVTMGGETPTMVALEAITRLVDGVIGNQDSLTEESFSADDSSQILEAPQYTRPEEYNDLKVPEVLCSGNHQKIKEWKEKESIKKTKENI